VDTTGSEEGGLRRPSPSSQAVAVVRRDFARPSSRWGDRSAQVALTQGMPPATLGSLRGHLAARTAYIDSQVQQTIARGVTQLVAVGAGYDDRALRFRTPGVRFFELDHSVTQADKRLRLEAMGAGIECPSLVAADFRVDPVDVGLAAAGHDAARASLFWCEGLLVYLDAPSIIFVLSGLRASAGPDSRLVATLALHAEGLTTATVIERANAARPNAEAEPWRTILPIGRHLELLERSGWSVIESVDDAAADAGSRSSRSVTVVAIPGPSGGPER
jgi:methyltransferase (TIGR00027 family)